MGLLIFFSCVVIITDVAKTAAAATIDAMYVETRIYQIIIDKFARIFLVETLRVDLTFECP